MGRGILHKKALQMKLAAVGAIERVAEAVEHQAEKVVATEQSDREKLKAELRAQIMAELALALGNKPTQRESDNGTKEAPPAATTEERPVSQAPVA